MDWSQSIADIEISGQVFWTVSYKQQRELISFYFFILGVKVQHCFETIRLVSLCRMKKVEDRITKTNARHKVMGAEIQK